MRKFFCLSLFLALSMLCIAGAAPAGKKQVTASVGQDGIQRVEVLAGEYFFDPDHIVVKVNVPVEIRIRKEPTIVPHNFVIKAPEAGMEILESLSSEPKTITFKPTKIGIYTFYCDKKLLFFKSHRARGMEGVLEVRE